MTAPPDYSAQLNATREISTKLTRKEDVSAELWAESGLKPNSRLKDVNTAIVTLKKKVSMLQKEEVENSDGSDDGSDERPRRQGAPGGDPKLAKTKEPSTRARGADKKAMQHAALRGDFDLKVDYVGGGGHDDDD